jgi:hypothetical protein
MKAVVLSSRVVVRSMEVVSSSRIEFRPIEAVLPSSRVKFRSMKAALASYAGGELISKENWRKDSMIRRWIKPYKSKLWRVVFLIGGRLYFY